MVCIHGKTLALSRLTTSISGGQPGGRASLHISCPVHHIAGITSTSGLPTGYGGALPRPLLVPTGGRTQERKSDDFKTFCMWLETHGPFGVIVDGANLAMFGQNNPDGGFDFRQIAAALGHARARHPELKPLVVGRPPPPPVHSRSVPRLVSADSLHSPSSMEISGQSFFPGGPWEHPPSATAVFWLWSDTARALPETAGRV